MREDLYALTADEKIKFDPPDPVQATDSIGRTWELLLDNDKWLRVGYIPRPTTRLGWFIYHLVHGLAMQYPPHKVLLYAMYNTKPEFIDLRGIFE